MDTKRPWFPGILWNWSLRIVHGVIMYDHVPVPFSIPAKGWCKLAGVGLSWSAFEDEFGRLLFNRLPEGYITTHPQIVRREAWKRLAARFGFSMPVVKFPPLPNWQKSLACTLPMWMLFLPAALATAVFWWKDGRWPRGLCRACGYDLRGNASGVCPECGEWVQDKSLPGLRPLATARALPGEEADPTDLHRRGKGDP